MEITGGIDPKCTLHIPSDFSPVKTIAVTALSNHQITECRTNSDILNSADSKEAVEDSDIAQREQMLQLNDSSEQESGDMVNGRRSLAWDSAFFDSAGILDEEELSNMIDGASISKKNCMSTYNTISTLERIEAELFTDIRASTQKFVKEPISGNLNGKAAVEEDRGTKVTNSSKKTVTTPSRNKVDTPSRSKVDTTSRNRSSPIVKKEPVSSEESQQTKRQGSRHVPAVQPVTSIHKAPITKGRTTNPISPQSITVSNANLSKLTPRKSKDTGRRDSSVKSLMGGVSTKPVSISRSISLSSSSSSHLINKTSSSVDLGRRVSSIHQKRSPSNTTTKGQTDLKSYLMLSNKLPSRKSSASSLSDTSSESCISSLASKNNNRLSNESSTSCKSVAQGRVGRTLDFMSKSNDRLLGTVRSLSKTMTNQDLKKGGPINGAKLVKPSSSSSSNSVGARNSGLNKGSSTQIGKGKVGSDSRWMM